MSLQCHEIQDFVKIKDDIVGCGSNIGRVEPHMVWARQVTVICKPVWPKCRGLEPWILVQLRSYCSTLGVHRTVICEKGAYGASSNTQSIPLISQHTLTQCLIINDPSSHKDCPTKQTFRPLQGNNAGSKQEPQQLQAWMTSQCWTP